MNGLLKGLRGAVSPPQLERLLARDVEIVAPAARASMPDLWPAIWALAAVLERQLYGRIFIRCGLAGPLPSPAPLGSRCEFVPEARPGTPVLSLQLGVVPEERRQKILVGDACAGAIS